MKVVVFGAAGIIGQAVVQEALRRKHEVTAVVPSPLALPLSDERLKVEDADIRRADAVAVAAVVRGYDAVINAFEPEAGREDALSAVASSLSGGLRAAEVSRVLVIGDAGSLKTDSGERLMDTSSFPEEKLPLAVAHESAYGIYDGTELEYTYISPPAVVVPGRRTGMFRIGLDRLVVDENGESLISAEDFAVAVIDELEEDNFLRERFTVAY